MKLSAWMRTASIRTAIACAALVPLGVAQAAWPDDKPLRVIVPFGAGSSPDQVARVVGERLAGILDQTVIVENRPGASGNIGTHAIATAEPDGYTFGVSITGPMVNNTVLFDNLPYDPFTEIAPLTLGVHQPNVLVVPTDSEIQTIDDLLEALKENPDTYNFPSPGAGTVSHLAVELMLQRLDSTAVHVPYPSSPAALTSVISGDTHFAALPPIAVMPMVKGDRLRALAVTSAERSPLLPEIPTLAEVGVEGIEGSAWIGFVISSKVDEDIQEQLSDALIEALHDEAVVNKLADSHMQAVGNSPEEFRAYMDEELERWGPLIENLGITQNKN